MPKKDNINKELKAFDKLNKKEYFNISIINDNIKEISIKIDKMKWKREVNSFLKEILLFIEAYNKYYYNLLKETILDKEKILIAKNTFNTINKFFVEFLLINISFFNEI